MLLQAINAAYWTEKKSRMEGFPEEEEEQEKCSEKILFPDAALSKIGRLLQAVHVACNWILGPKGIIVISPKGILVTYFYNAQSILDNLILHRTAWQQGKADTASTTTCCNVHISGHQYWCN